jgi:transposase
LADSSKKFHISEEEWAQTPPKIREIVELLLEENKVLKNDIDELKAKLNQDSSNSNKPPSSDSPFAESKNESQEELPKKKKKKRKHGGQKGHKGHKHELLEPTHEEHVRTTTCVCGHTELDDQGIYYTHQEVELPEIQLEVRHFHLHQEQCPNCGRIHKAGAPKGHQTGYAPRFCAFLAVICGIQGNSRETAQAFCQEILGFHISIGAIQKVIDRVSESIAPHYECFRDKAWEARVNNIDETSWKLGGALNWLWVMANVSVVYFMVHSNRTKEAFKELVGPWMGILVSDNYGVYKKWVGGRQKCLAHLIRTAQGLADHPNAEIARCGRWAKAELQRLIKMANAPPSKGEWLAFYARLCHLIVIYQDRKDKAGTFVRSLSKEIESLWLFLEEHGVEPTNNFAERMIRFGVLWRKRSLGTRSQKGNRWVERLLSLRQTCRMHNISSFQVMVDAMESYFKEQEPDLGWIKVL